MFVYSIMDKEEVEGAITLITNRTLTAIEF
jgi:hypothetical protein